MQNVLPYKISTLIFIENLEGQLLLMKRNKEPNKDCYSPIGGKLEMSLGESPHQCAKREIFEEVALDVDISNLHLFSMVSEKSYENNTHWLMFLFVSKQKIDKLPDNIDEGTFEFFSREQINEIKIPDTDREILWKIYDEHRDDFVSIYIDCSDKDNMNIDIHEVLKNGR